MPSLQEVEAAALELINETRFQHGMPAIRWNTKNLTDDDREQWMARARAALQAAEKVRVRCGLCG